MQVNHVERKHARLSASRAERFMHCPGSVALENQMPYEPAGEAAITGTRIHEYGERLLAGEHGPDMISKGADATEVAMAQGYADFVNTLCKEPKFKRIEVNVDSGLVSLHPSLGGTADAVLGEGNTLHVVDLKTGRVPVSAEENLQLMTYALGAMRKFNAPADINVALHIYQPKTGHSRWDTTGQRLIEHGEQLKQAAELALSPNAPTNPGDSQCKYCRAKTICPSLRERVISAARKELLPDQGITPEMLDDAKLAEAWSAAVIDAAKQKLDSGESISGWTLRPGRKTKFWRDEALVQEFFRSNPEAWDLKSPAAIARLKIDAPDQLIGEKQTAPSLVREKE